MKLGGDEMEKAREYTSKEKRYVKALLATNASLNDLDERYFSIARCRISESICGFSVAVRAFRMMVSDLVELERGRPLRSFMPTPMLKERATMLFSVSKALEHDYASGGLSSDYLISEDVIVIGDVLESIHSDIQERLNVELDHVENWQNQSLFFFEKLETLLVYFFILTTFFTFTAFLISGHALRRYLGFLSAGAGEISSGNLDYRFNDSTSDLIGDVMSDFDAMAERLSVQTGKLAAINTELAKKAAELEEANRHKDRFLANMSHELRTPLNSIIGFSELIMAKSAKLAPEKSAEFAGRILTAAEHLLSLITDLLEIAKVDAGVMDVVKDKFDLRSLGDEVVEMLRPIADEKGLRLEFKESPPVLNVTADKRLLRQVLINLLNNALKFTHEGKVTLEMSQDGGGTRIDVKDTGIGISKQDCELIFKDFHRVEQGLTSKYEGVGLGLALTKRIVDIHGGALEVDSLLGEGSVFTVVLPNSVNCEGD
jgi:signal transduction histidine kinase